MKSYLELLEANISENVEGTGGDVIGTIAKLLGIDRDKAEARMGKLPIDNATEVADAASQGDTAEIMLRLGAMKDDDSLDEGILAPSQPPLPKGIDREDELGNIINGGPQTGNPDLVDPNDPNQMVDPTTNLTPLQQQQNANQQAGQPPSAEQQAMARQQQQRPQSGSNRPPVKPSGTVTQSRGTQGTGPRQQFAEDFSAGDEVKVKDKEAIVSGIDDGPAGTNTVGVLVDGTLEMVKKEKAMKKTVEEGILGVTAMPSMRQMMELAMFQSKESDDETEEKDGDDEEKAEEAKAEGNDPKPEAASEPKQEEAPAAAPQSAIAIFDVQTGSTADVGTPTAEIEQPVQACDPAAATCPREQILKALDVIERSMPDLRVGDFKDVRMRLEKISNVIVEKAMNRRPKL